MKKIYETSFDLKRKYLFLKDLIPTQSKPNEVKFSIVLEEIKHGYDAPIITLEHKGKEYILDGHHRAYALNKIGFEKIESIIIKPKSHIEMNISETTKKANITKIEDLSIVKS